MFLLNMLCHFVFLLLVLFLMPTIISCWHYVQSHNFWAHSYDDSATTDKRPMINIMMASAHEPQALLDVVDCTLELAEGGVKDTHYIASQCTPKIEQKEFIYWSPLTVQGICQNCTGDCSKAPKGVNYTWSKACHFSSSIINEEPLLLANVIL